MQRFRHILRICLIVALIPLTVFSGRVASGCICSDGHFEPLCDGGNCCSGPADSANADSCGCRKCCKSADGTTASCCLHVTHPSHLGQSPGGDGSQTCCHPLALSPMVAENSSAVQSQVELPEFHEPVTVALLPVIVEQIAFVPLVASGPPRVRLYVLQSLLI